MLKEFGKLSGRTLARCPPRLASAGRGAAKDCGGTVYQKHRSVQTRKRKYTGWNLPSAGRLSAWVIWLRPNGLQSKPRWTAAVTMKQL